MAKPWEMNWSSPQAPGLRAVPLPEKPNSPTPQTAAQARKDVLEAQKTQLELVKLERELAKAPSSTDIEGVATDLRNVLDNVFRAKEISRNSWTATGFGAPAARVVGKLIGGNAAAALEGKLDVIGSNTAFDRLQKMRENSPTGGALGSITERELHLLKSTIASLSADQPDEDFQGSMQAVADAYGRILAKLPGGRKMMIERGWLPKAGGAKPRRQAPQKQSAKPRIINFDDLPE